MERSLLEGDALAEVRRLKEQDGSYLLVYAGGEFVGSLIEADLIDEYHLFIHPVVLGSGKPLFPRGVNKELTVTSTKAAATGVTVLTVAPVR